MRYAVTSLLALVGWILAGTAAQAQAPPALACRGIGTDDALRPLSPALVPAATRLFHLEAMPREQVMRSTYFRCDRGAVFVCNTGANLPCGKANTSRSLPAADTWCAEHEGSDFIPMYVTGHDTIYRWRCTGPKAAIAATEFKIDRRGFITRFWKRLDP